MTEIILSAVGAVSYFAIGYLCSFLIVAFVAGPGDQS